MFIRREGKKEEREGHGLNSAGRFPPTTRHRLPALGSHLGSLLELGLQS